MPAPALSPASSSPTGPASGPAAAPAASAGGWAASGAGLAVALNGEGAAPEWVQLTPDAVVIAGRDGRSWKQSDLAQVINRFATSGVDLPVDIEHASQIKGARGEPAPAVGWIKQLEQRGKALWARVEWTAEGAQAIASRAYRYLSPVFEHSKATGEVSRIRSAGLTNMPNLDLVALNRAQSHTSTIPETPMDPSINSLIGAALGLGPDATPDQAVAAIAALKAATATALNRVTSLEAAAAAPDMAAAAPDMTKFVPRADYETALNRATALEAEAQKAADARIEASVDAAIAAGRIAPASKGYHLAACRQDGGLAAFEAMVGATPAIVTPARPGVAGTPPGAATALNAEEIAVADMLGIPHADFAAAKQDA